MVASVDGRFGHLEGKITQIDACDTEQAVQRIIDAVDDDLNATLKDPLIKLNTSLSARNIEILNDVLVWVVGLSPTSSVLSAKRPLLEVRRKILLGRYGRR